MATLKDFLEEKIKACLASQNLPVTKENVKVVYDGYFNSSNSLSVEKLVKRIKTKELV